MDAEAPVKKSFRTEGGGKPTRNKGQQEDSDAALRSGPFSLLHNSVQAKSEVLITCRDGRRLFAKVRAFDKHFNMVLQDITEITADASGVMKSRPLFNLFLRGDTVVFVVKL